MKKIQQAIVIDKAEAKLLKKILSAVVYNGNHVQPKAYVPKDRGEYCIACDLLNKATDAYLNT